MRRQGLPVDRLADGALLEGFGAGDEELSVAFVRRFQAKVFGVALAVCGQANLADDIAQQAFERAWLHASLYDARRGGVGTWLNVITRNLAIDSTRRRVAVPVDPADLVSQLVSSSDDPEAAALRSDGTAKLRAALAELPPAQARCLAMAAIRGLTAAEIAEIEGIPLGTAKTRIRAGMIGLRRSMAATDPALGPDGGASQRGRGGSGE